jgi:hypothetical protein
MSDVTTLSLAESAKVRVKIGLRVGVRVRVRVKKTRHVI